jgi:DNA polymerase V
MNKGSYIAIDLKSFYASVECVERGLDPLTTCLVAADESRTEKTICLAASPAIKKYGVPGRARLFEVIQKIKFANSSRKLFAPGRKLVGESCDVVELEKNPKLAISYIVAPPRMALYMEYSTRVFGVYLRYISPKDIHPYSIDEVFIDVGPYLSTYRMTAHELTMKMIREVLAETGITATAGIGTNLYEAKDILNKGRNEGRLEGRAEGIVLGQTQMLTQLVLSKLKKHKSPEAIADALEISEDKVLDIARQNGFAI